MGSLAKAVLLSVLLDPALLLTRQDPESQSKEPTPSLNVRFDPRRMNLTWDCRENTAAITCQMFPKGKDPVIKKLKEKACHCTFEKHDLHGGITFMITVNVSHKLIAEKLFYTNPGGEGTAAQNFSCVVYNAKFMNCTWAKGAAAPDDIQYFLYIQDIKGKKERECPHYTEDSGTHVGCHLQDLSELTFHTYFLVNGTSRRTGVRFFDTILSLHNIERYSPPHNITVHCNQSHCLIQWEKPRIHRKKVSDREFLFQLDIRMLDNVQPSGSQPVYVSGSSGTKYSLVSPQPRSRHTVRIRAANDRVQHWGDWSQPVVFGSEEWEPSPILVCVLVVLGTLFCGLILGFLVKRFFGLHCLSPRIPQIKDILNENHPNNQQIMWETVALGTGKGNNEEVTTVQEVTEPRATQ